MSTYESRRTEAFEAWFFETKKTAPLWELVNKVRDKSHHGYSKTQPSDEYIQACLKLREWILKHLKAFPDKLYYGFDSEGFDRVDKKLFLRANEEYGIPEYLEILFEDNHGDKIMEDVFPEGLDKLMRQMKRAAKKIKIGAK